MNAMLLLSLAALSNVRKVYSIESLCETEINGLILAPELLTKELERLTFELSDMGYAIEFPRLGNYTDRHFRLYELTD